jgi:acid phosphatase
MNRAGRVVALLCLAACEGKLDAAPDRDAVPTPEPPPAAEVADQSSLDAVVWMQRSIEYEAVATAAYATAGRMLEVALRDPAWTAALEQGTAAGKTPAVVLDVDETVLDNSPYAAYLLAEGRQFERATWDRWCAEATATAVPGAVEFTRGAAERGVAVFYVSNRDAAVEAATLRNLRTLGFPVDEEGEHLMLRGERPEWASEKGSRRTEIARTHRILLLLGDTLGDFVDGADASEAARTELFAAHVGDWGTRWIMLPNPDYGGWERALYEGKTPAPPEQRRRKLAALERWGPQPERWGPQPEQTSSGK